MIRHASIAATALVRLGLVLAILALVPPSVNAAPRNMATDQCQRLPDSLTPAQRQAVDECARQISDDIANNVGRNQQHWLGCEGGKIYCCKNNPPVQGPPVCTAINMTSDQLPAFEYAFPPIVRPPQSVPTPGLVPQ